MKRKQYLIPSIALLCVIVLHLSGAPGQDMTFYSFANHGKVLGIPDFLNVITNLAFFFIAIFGLATARKVKDKKLHLMVLTLFFGFILRTLGKLQLLLDSQSITLVFDRLPMVIIFMSFFAFIIYNGMGEEIGHTAFRGVLPFESACLNVPIAMPYD